MTSEGEAGEAGRIAAGPASGSVESATIPGDDTAEDGARRLLRRRGRSVRDEQLARALAEADLTPQEEAELARLADRLVDALLAGPRQSLRTASDRQSTAATVRDLFG